MIDYWNFVRDQILAKRLLDQLETPDGNPDSVEEEICRNPVQPSEPA